MSNDRLGGGGVDKLTGNLQRKLYTGSPEEVEGVKKQVLHVLSLYP